MFPSFEELEREQEGEGECLPRAERDLALLQPQRYRRLDAGARSPDDWPAENRVAATVRLQRSGSSPELLARLREEMERFPGAENEAFRRALYAWAKALEAESRA